eukprot:3377480-Prymnesium_polylepis.2
MARVRLHATPSRAQMSHPASGGRCGCGDACGGSVRARTALQSVQARERNNVYAHYIPNHTIQLSVS